MCYIAYIPQTFNVIFFILFTVWCIIQTGLNDNDISVLLKINQPKSGKNVERWIQNVSVNIKHINDLTT